jgi:hypothetical protein
MDTESQVTRTGDQGGGNNAAESLGWRAGLPDEYKNDETLAQFKTVGDFAKFHFDETGKAAAQATELETKLAGAIFKPGDDAAPEEQAAFWRQLGMPEKADDYEFAQADGIENSPEMVDWARAAFHKAHLTQEQVAAIVPAWNTFVKGMEQAQAAAREKARSDAEQKLRAEWGAGFDANVESVRRAFIALTDTNIDAFLEETGLGNDVRLIRMMHTIHERFMREDSSPPGTGRPTDTKAGMLYDKSPAPPQGG